MSLPLSGRRVLVTRAAHQVSKLSEGLRVLGAQPVEVPVIEIQAPVSYEPLDHALHHLYGYDWLILTSANTVRMLVERAATLKLSLISQPLHIAAIGEATSEAARSAGLRIKVTPDTYVAESLVSALATRIHGKNILVARAAVARDVIPDALRAAGATVNVVDAYQNVVPSAAPDQLRHALAEGIDGATFTSSSSASHLAEVARRGDAPFPFARVPAISIGPITSQTLRSLGWPPAAEAETHDIPGLIAAVVHFFSNVS